MNIKGYNYYEHFVMDLFGQKNLNDDSLSDEEKKEIYEKRLQSNNINFQKSDYSVRKVIKYESGIPSDIVLHLNFKIDNKETFKLVEGYVVNLELVDNFKSKIEEDSRTKDLIKVNDIISWKTKNPPRTKAMIELWLKDGIQLTYPKKGNSYADVKTFDKSTEEDEDTQIVAQTPAEDTQNETEKVTQQIVQESENDEKENNSVPLTLEDSGDQDEKVVEVTQKIFEESQRDKGMGDYLPTIEEEVTRAKKDNDKEKLNQEISQSEEVTEQESKKEVIEVVKEKTFFEKYMIIIIIVVLLLLGVGAYFIFGGKSSDSGFDF